MPRLRCALACAVALAAGLSSSAVAQEAGFGDSILDAVVVPANGAVFVPTNAHMFFPLPQPLLVTVASPSLQSTVALDVPAATGVPLGALAPNANVTVVLDDGTDARGVAFHTGPVDDTSLPVLRGPVRARADNGRLVLALAPADDDIGVAVYVAQQLDAAGRAHGVQLMVPAPPPNQQVELRTAFAGDGDFSVTAVDLAGNESAPSAPVHVHVDAGGGCAATSGEGGLAAVAAAVAAALAATVRRRARRA